MIVVDVFACPSGPNQLAARGETYEIAFITDNPGIWMNHCHDLVHASDGLVAHLAYTGVHTPYRIGDDPGNEPE